MTTNNTTPNTCIKSEIQAIIKLNKSLGHNEWAAVHKTIAMLEALLENGQIHNNKDTALDGYHLLCQYVGRGLNKNFRGDKIKDLIDSVCQYAPAAEITESQLQLIDQLIALGAGQYHQKFSAKIQQFNWHEIVAAVEALDDAGVIEVIGNQLYVYFVATPAVVATEGTAPVEISTAIETPVLSPTAKQIAAAKKRCLKAWAAGREFNPRSEAGRIAKAELIAAQYAPLAELVEQLPALTPKKISDGKRPNGKRNARFALGNFVVRVSGDNICSISNTATGQFWTAAPQFAAIQSAILF